MLKKYINNETIQFDSFIQELDFKYWVFSIFLIVIKFLILGIILYVLFLVFKKIIKFIIKPIIKSIPPFLGGVIYSNKIFNSIALFFSLLFSSIVLEFFFNPYPLILHNMKKLFSIFFVIVLFQFLIRTTKLITEIITIDENNHRSVAIKSFYQLLRIFFIFLCIMVIISILYNIEINTILTSLGTLTAVIVLIFRDTILGFVSGMQIASTKMIKVGDWVLISKYSIEGIVIEINLFSIKIENFDKTISTIPTYDLINTSVTNFEIIKQRNIRRIKQSIIFNVDYFKFYNFEEIKKLEKDLNFEIISNNLFNNKDFKKITNISIYRTYIISYLINNNNISKKEPIIVRNLQFNNFGMPIEIYCFANTSNWEKYEKIQSNILDHLFTISKKFDLKIVNVKI